MLYLFITVLIYGLVMGGINMLISTISDMKREKAGEENPDVQEPDAALEEESKTVVAEADAPLVTAGIKGGRPCQGIDDIFRVKAKGKEGILKEFLLKIAVEDQNLVEGYANRLAKYFAKQCSAVSPDSYIRTFRNSKDRNPWDEESERILVNLMDS